MSSDEQKLFLNDISSEIERHKDLYKFVEFKSVIARRKDIPNWHNFITLISMLYSGSSRPWEKQLEKNNFAILSAILTLDDFKGILERLVSDHILEVAGYQAYGPFNLGQKDFLDSEQSKRLYNIDWAVNMWRATGKENPGLPDSRSIELESEDIPFRDPQSAIRYYTGISIQNDSSLQNAIHVVAPLYYARIKKVELSTKELLVETGFDLVGAQDIRIGYNTEGPDERAQYYKTLEASTVRPANGLTTIQLEEVAEAATVWLYHTAGFKIDSRSVRKKPSIENLETDLSRENPYLWDEGIRVITDAIVSTSITKIPDLVTTELGVDSIDIEILKAIKTRGGGYANFIPEVLKYISLNMLLSRLARLKMLGFLTVQPPRKILLTSLGVDALNIPPSALAAKVPPNVSMRMAEIRLAFQREDYHEVMNKSTKLLEAILREGLEDKFRGTVQNVWPNLKLEPYDRASLGTLREACLRLSVLEKNSTADHLLSIILKLRVPMTHEKEEVTSPSSVGLLTVNLVEAFVRNWYYLKL
jgi:hypothetical protein